VVQSNGYYKLYANGNEVYSWDTDTWDMTSWVPDAVWKDVISVGRNAWDGWSTYNGNLGDLFLYKVALDEAQRLTLEADLAAKYGISGLPDTPTPLPDTPTPRPPTTGVKDWSMFE
jgi:hypothetical protein